MQNLYGIDYGAKLAGTTVVAWIEGGKVHFSNSAKKQDADRFLLDFFGGRPPAKIFIDAPLSLPEVYATGTANFPAPQESVGRGEVPDFHYRACDRELGAMSPMFLGGLTARAMKLAFMLRGRGHEVRETYPGGLARHLELDKYEYKRNKEAIPTCLPAILDIFGQGVQIAEIATWHHFDALLSMASGLRFSRGEALQAGNNNGLIVF